MEATRIHPSVKPCELWETKHSCYSCDCAASAIHYHANDIANAIEDAGIPCQIEQTGGFTMVVYVRNGDACIGITSECMVFCKGEDDENCVHIPCKPLDDSLSLTPENLAIVAETVKANLWRIKGE